MLGRPLATVLGYLCWHGCAHVCLSVSGVLRWHFGHGGRPSAGGRRSPGPDQSRRTLRSAHQQLPVRTVQSKTKQNTTVQNSHVLLLFSPCVNAVLLAQKLYKKCLSHHFSYIGGGTCLQQGHKLMVYHLSWKWVSVSAVSLCFCSPFTGSDRGGWGVIPRHRPAEGGWAKRSHRHRHSEPRYGNRVKKVCL